VKMVKMLSQRMMEGEDVKPKDNRMLKMPDRKMTRGARCQARI